MRTARIIVIWLFVTSASIVPALAQQQSNREKSGLIGPVRTIVEKSGTVEEKPYIFSVAKTYDVQGRLAETEFALFGPRESSTEIKGLTVYTYGDKGKIFGTSYQKGTVSSTSLSLFDANGRPTEFSIYNPKGVLTFRPVQRYDDRGSKTEAITYKIGGTIAFRSLYTYDADANGKVENVISYKSDGSVDYKTRTKYDGKGHMLEELFSRADGTTSERRTYIYDENGQEQEKVVYYSDGSIWTREVSAYEYDSVGNWTKKTTQKLVSKDGNLIPESTAITERVIRYY